MKVGLCLYSVKKALAQDPLGTMEKVAALGFRYWETPAATPAPLDGSPSIPTAFGLKIPAKVAKQFIDDHGITITGNHYFPYDYPNFEEYLEYQAALGLTFVGPSADFYTGYDDVLRKCEKLNRAAEKAKSYGLQFYYHNHFHEFQRFNGKTVEDLIYENTDPALVKLQLDTYWAARGGADPVELIHRYADRLVSLHQKDFAKDAGEPVDLFAQKVDPSAPIDHALYQSLRHVGTFAEVGTGVLDIQSMIDAGNRAGVGMIYLEQDLTRLNELESVRISMEQFHQYGGIEWDSPQ